MRDQRGLIGENFVPRFLTPHRGSGGRSRRWIPLSSGTEKYSKRMIPERAQPSERAGKRLRVDGRESDKRGNWKIDLRLRARIRHGVSRRLSGSLRSFPAATVPGDLAILTSSRDSSFILINGAAEPPTRGPGPSTLRPSPPRARSIVKFNSPIAPGD